MREDRRIETVNMLTQGDGGERQREREREREKREEM